MKFNDLKAIVVKYPLEQQYEISFMDETTRTLYNFADGRTHKLKIDELIPDEFKIKLNFHK